MLTIYSIKGTANVQRKGSGTFVEYVRTTCQAFACTRSHRREKAWPRLGGDQPELYKKKEAENRKEVGVMDSQSSLINRMVRAAKLDIHLYEEVEADATANSQALTAVVIASIASGIGTGIAGIRVEGGIWFLWGLLIGVATALAGWLIWSLFAYWLGTTIFKGPRTSANYGELLRTIGFSNSPRVLSIFAFIPFIGGLIALVRLYGH